MKNRPSRRVRRATGSALIAALLAFPAALAAQQPQQPVPLALSLDDAIDIALGANPALLQQKNDIDVAEMAVRSAYGSLFPTASASSSFGYTAEGEPRFGSVEFGRQPAMYSSSFSVSANLQLSGSSLLQPSVERSRARATSRRVEGAEANLVSQVKQQYLSVLQSREQVAQAEREVERTEEHVRLAEARLEVGAGTPLDVRRAEVQRGQAQVGLLQAENQYQTGMLLLGQLLGTPLDSSTTLTSEFAVFDPQWEAEELLDLASRNNPSLLAARSTADAASTSVRAARSAYLPSLSARLGLNGSVFQAADIGPLVDQQLNTRTYQQCRQDNQILELIGQPTRPCLNPADPVAQQLVRDQVRQGNRGFPFDYTNQPWDAAITISLPIFTGLDRQLQVDQAQAAAADARYEVRSEELRLRQEIGTAVLNLRTANRTVHLQEQVRDAAEEELRLAQERFRFGAASSVEVTDAQTNLAQAERDLISAIYNFHQTLAQLEALVGQELR